MARASRFLSREPEQTVRVKAVKRGNVNAASGGYHFDPKGHERARSAIVPISVAEEAKRKGLVEIEGEARRSPSRQHLRVAGQAAERRQSTAEAMGGPVTETLGTGGADTRDTTRFPNDPSSLARTGTATVERLSDSDDDLGGEGGEGGEGQGADGALAGVDGGTDGDADEDEGERLPGGDAPPSGDEDSSVEGNTGTGEPSAADQAQHGNLAGEGAGSDSGTDGAAGDLGAAAVETGEATETAPAPATRKARGAAGRVTGG